jgi:hypothetical protein
MLWSPKEFRGITFTLSNFGHKQYPSITLTKIIQSMMFTEYPHESIIFFFRFKLLIFGGKERFYGWSVRIESLF